MKAGRKRKPTTLKELAGNPGKRPLNLEEPTPPPLPSDSILQPPEWMDELAKAEWLKVAPCLQPLGLLSALDRAALEAYCVAYSRWRKAEDAIAKLEQAGGADGRSALLIKTPSGYVQENPYVTIARKYHGVMRAWMSEFGMTPSSRTGIFSGEFTPLPARQPDTKTTSVESSSKLSKSELARNFFHEA